MILLLCQFQFNNLILLKIPFLYVDILRYFLFKFHIVFSILSTTYKMDLLLLYS